MLAYFGENPRLLSEEFFNTLNLFVNEFNATKAVFERSLAASEKKKASDGPGAYASKRASVVISSVRLAPVTNCFFSQQN